ncbi:hypothetical protein EVAR_98925_1 [Eumeta japonica]|uniref:Uncharacterized protein n=1 Tax=Eumeta variegata TaxID=151549 RepID=A0A4C2A0A3_EUMVA|nr:hypothetical protein EVAR_98925_1 [Eumeta japonica]
MLMLYENRLFIDRAKPLSAEGIVVKNAASQPEGTGLDTDQGGYQIKPPCRRLVGRVKPSAPEVVTMTVTVLVSSFRTGLGDLAPSETAARGGCSGLPP